MHIAVRCVHIEQGVDIVARMSTSAVGWKEVQEFVKAGKK